MKVYNTIVKTNTNLPEQLKLTQKINSNLWYKQKNLNSQSLQIPSDFVDEDTKTA